MTMVATKTITKFFKTSSTKEFLLLAQNDKKGHENSNCTFPLKIDAFFII